MKESYVLGMFQNGIVRPCIIRRQYPPLLSIGDRIITDKGNAVCVTTEVGRYGDDDEVQKIADAMDFNRTALPVILGQIDERIWKDEE